MQLCQTRYRVLETYRCLHARNPQDRAKRGGYLRGDCASLPQAARIPSLHQESPMRQLHDLTGKTALVTGASGGLGKQFALALAQQGARVAVAARRLDALAEVVKEIEASGGKAVAVRLDVTDEQSIKDCIAACTTSLGGVDVLVNNSGVSIAKPVLEQTAADWDAVVNTNLRGVFLVATEVARAMRDSNRGGSIINIASILGFRQIGHVLPYAASKAGVVQLTKSLALEVARYNIRVNAIAPGYFATDINRDFFDTDAGAAMLRRIPQRRLGQADELIGALLLLASDASSYMTGSTITVDGGHLVSSL
jgi:NAD(P)-dependent dehydrogenase (short-subunit alcohol dehydrogenase family)